jgi:PST family polysaccharide transporter
VVQLVSLATFPVFLLLATQAEQVILILLGEKWVEGTGVLIFLALGAMVGSVQWFNGTVMVASGRPGWRLLLQLANTFGSILAFFLTYPFGITAVAAGFTIRAYLSFPLGLLFLRRLLPVRLGEYYRKLAPAFAAGLAGASVALVVGYVLGDLNLVFRSVIGTLLGFACYAGLLYLFAPRLIGRILEYARVISGTGRRE